MNIKQTTDCDKCTIKSLLSVEVALRCILKDAVTLPKGPWETGYRMMALDVEDLDQAVEYLAGKVVVITWGPVILVKSKRAEIQDPDGNSIELRQW